MTLKFNIFIFIITFIATILVEEILFRFLRHILGWDMCVEGCSRNFSNAVGTIIFFAIPIFLSIATLLYKNKILKSTRWLMALILSFICVLIIAYLATDYGYVRTSDPLAP